MRPQASRADFDEEHGDASSAPSLLPVEADRWSELLEQRSRRARRRVAKHHRRAARQTVATARARGFAVTTILPEGQDALRREADRYGLAVEFESRLGFVQAVVHARSASPQLGPLGRFLRRSHQRAHAVE